MKNNNLIKAFIYCLITSVLLFVYKYLNDIKYVNIIDDKKTIVKETETVEDVVNVKESDNRLKYILLWTSPNTVPFVYMGEGQKSFKDRNCTFTNCFVTSNRLYLGDYTKFDVIAFASTEVRYMQRGALYDRLPQRRSPHQKYVFASIESADNYPMCSNSFNGFFNWTWTYRLDSDARWGYVAIRDSNYKLVGPKTDMHWMKYEDMAPVSEDVKDILRNKTKAAAWFVSNCYSRSEREIFVRNLKFHLAKYNLIVDVYGDCASKKCPREKDNECNKMIEKDYYFYLSFENSFAEDYVTEKILHPLKNYAVPVVYGGANYTRFMPDGIYLNARELGPRRLAKKMQELIKNPDAYAEFFRWRNHYSYHLRHESIETDDYCRFCSMLNEEDLVRRTSVYETFREWWDPPKRCL